MWSLNLLPVFKNLIHKIVWNEMELNSYRGSCHRFIPRCLTLVNGLHEIFPVNKLSNWIRLSTTHCLLVINLLQEGGGVDGAGRQAGLSLVWMFLPLLLLLLLQTLVSGCFNAQRPNTPRLVAVKLQHGVKKEREGVYVKNHLSIFPCFGLPLWGQGIFYLAKSTGIAPPPGSRISNWQLLAPAS